MVEQRITWTYRFGDEKVIFKFSMDAMTHKEVFMKWVDFMNAIGYAVDRAEMEAMWNGE